MSTSNGIITVFVKMDVVLPEMLAVFALWVCHQNHLTYILEFITLKVNRVINSMVFFLRGEEMKYSERIRSLREDHDLSQSKIAELLNIGQRTYCDYERGKTRIPVDSLIVLAKFYNVSMDYICGISEEKENYPTK